MNRGWISLPIIVLLLAVAALSMAYQQSQLAAYKWLAQLKDGEDEQQWWRDFEQAFVVSPHFATATKSECNGFCALDARQARSAKTWRHDSHSVSYQWRWFSYVVDDSSGQTDSGGQTRVSYRLCATENRRQYLCWWWRDNKLLANGRVSASY